MLRSVVDFLCFVHAHIHTFLCRARLCRPRTTRRPNNPAADSVVTCAQLLAAKDSAVSSDLELIDGLLHGGIGSGGNHVHLWQLGGRLVQVLERRLRRFEHSACPKPAPLERLTCPKNRAQTSAGPRRESSSVKKEGRRWRTVIGRRGRLRGAQAGVGVGRSTRPPAQTARRHSETSAQDRCSCRRDPLGGRGHTAVLQATPAARGNCPG